MLSKPNTENAWKYMIIEQSSFPFWPALLYYFMQLQLGKMNKPFSWLKKAHQLQHGLYSGMILLSCYSLKSFYLSRNIQIFAGLKFFIYVYPYVLSSAVFQLLYHYVARCYANYFVIDVRISKVLMLKQQDFMQSFLMQFRFFDTLFCIINILLLLHIMKDKTTSYISVIQWLLTSMYFCIHSYVSQFSLFCIVHFLNSYYIYIYI